LVIVWILVFGDWSFNVYTDFGYMEEGKLGKAYDFRLMWRLWGFIRPYWRLMALSLLLVLVMTSLDLVIPYLTKVVIDRHIVVSAREVVIRDGSRPETEKFLARYGKDLVPKTEEGRFLLPPAAIRTMDRKEIVLLQKSGLLSENLYTLFTSSGREGDKIFEKYPSLFQKTGAYWFIPTARMKEVSREDLLILRQGNIQGILRVALVVILILAVHFGLNFFQVYTMEIAGQRVMHDLRMKIFSHLQSFSVSFFDRNPVGRLVTRLTNDVQNVHEMFTSILIYLVKDVLLLAGIVVVLFQFNRKLALVSFSVLPLVFLFALFFSRRARDAFREIRLKIAQMNAFFQENFSGIQVVQIFRREKENARRFEKINEAHYLANMRQISIYALFVPLIEVLSSGAIGLLIWYGGGEVIQETMTLGVLVAFLAYMRMLFQPIRDLSEKYTILQSAMASLERIYGLLDQEERFSVFPVPVQKEVKGEVEFRRVSFSYNGEGNVLTDVSFSVGVGETVAIVGATGAGKSSLLNLLERFYEIKEGSILVDGTSIREWDHSKLRSQIGLVMQDTFLFSGSIADNIRMGDQEGEGERIREAARIVNADAFIQRLPQGYSTKVGEGGESLSAGEKQLLAFARALYLNPKILVLDEATSHVDPETEWLIREGLGRLLRGRTAIVVAHRLSTIQHADRIVVLHKGRVREVGPHGELMAKGGFYARLYQLQNGYLAD
jgi:ABC-type multidrug transport system fused ATPase/permease subunit